MGLFDTDAVVLRHYELGEADKIIVLFSQQRGKIRAVAKGVRKTKSTLAAALEVFTHNHVLVYQGKSDLGRISQCEIEESFSNLRSDVNKMGYASYVAELINELTTGQQAQPQVFSLLVLTLKLLNEFAELDLILRAFELKLLALLGYRPHLDSCVKCGGALDQRIKFNLEEGGVVCSQHARSVDKKISPGTVKFMQRLLQLDYQDLLNLRFADYANQELFTIIPSYIESIIEKPLKTTTFLTSLQTFEEG